MFQQVIFFFLGIVTVAGSILLPNYLEVNPVVQVLLAVMGIILILIGLFFSAYAAFYRKGQPDESIVRVGGFTQKQKLASVNQPDVALRSGMWVIGMVHNTKIVSHRQYVLTVDRRGDQALICKDSKLADVLATFKVSVGQQAEDVLKFVAKAGSHEEEETEDMNRRNVIEVLIGDTIETALRDACTAKNYMDVFEDREGIAKAIEDSVDDDFKKMGLVLDSVKLKDVDMTPEHYYKASNPQHAVGLTAIVEIIEDQRLATETKKLRTSEAIKAQEVKTNAEILALDQQDAFAKSEQQKQVAIRIAADLRASEEAGIAERQAVETRQIEKNEAIAVRTAEQARAGEEAEIEHQRSVAVAEEKKQLVLEAEKQAREEAEIQRQKSVAVAEEKKLLALEAERQARALAEAERVVAETKLEEARQQLLMVEETQTAQRVAEVKLIEAAKKAEEELVTKQKAADARAYEIERAAKAKKLAAEDEANAITTAAVAEKTAALARAAGDEAEKMVNVKVRDEEVTILERELKAKEENQESAIKLELGLEQLRVTGEVQVAFANALPNLLGGANMNIVGTPEMLSETLNGIARAMGFTALVNGVAGGVNDEVKDLTVSGVQGLGNMLKTIIHSFAGNEELTPEAIAKVLARPDVQNMLASSLLPNLLSANKGTEAPKSESQRNPKSNPAGR